MTTAGSMDSVPAALDDERHEPYQQRPRQENIGVQERDAEELGGTREQREQRVVEKERAQEEQRDQPLPLEPAHQSRLTPDVSRVTPFCRAARESPDSRASRRPA